MLGLKKAMENFELRFPTELNTIKIRKEHKKRQNSLGCTHETENPCIFRKLRKMYLEDETVNIKKIKNYTKLPQIILRKNVSDFKLNTQNDSFNNTPTYTNFDNSQQNMPIQFSSKRLIENNISACDLMTHNEMMLIAGLKQTETPLNSNFSQFKSTITKINHKFELSKSEKKNQKDSPRGNSFFRIRTRKESENAKRKNSSVKKKTQISRWNKALENNSEENISERKKSNEPIIKLAPKYPMHSTVMKFINMLVDKDPLYAFFKWALQCKNSLLDNRKILNYYIICCLKYHVAPIQLHTDDAGLIFLLENIEITEGIGKAIGKIIPYCPDLQKLIINCKNATDTGLSAIIKGASRAKSLRQISLQGGMPLGVKSIFKLSKFINKPKPQNLIDLSVICIEVPSVLLGILTENMANTKMLQRLTLNEMNFDDISLDYLIDVIKNSKELYYLNLSKIVVNCIQLSKITNAISLSTKFEYVDISNIAFGAQGRGMITETRQELLHILSDFIKKSMRLIHLDICNTKLSEQQAAKIIKSACESASLRSIHLSHDCVSDKFSNDWISKDLCEITKGLNLFEIEKQSLVIWRPKDLSALGEKWIISNECFICNHWNISVFSCSQYVLSKEPTRRLITETYKSLEIPIQYKASPQTFTKIVESQFEHFYPCYNITPKQIYDPVYFVCIMLPPKEAEKYRITAGSIEVLHGTINIEPRLSEIRGNYKSLKKARIFAKSDSVFANWQEDTGEIIEKMMKIDYYSSKLAKFIKLESESRQLLSMLCQYGVKIKELFISIASRSKYPNIGWLDFTSFFKKKKILEGCCTLSDLDRFFIAVNIDIEKDAIEEKDEANPERELCRHEFVEILVRIANRKYRESKRVKTYANALKCLIDDLLSDTDLCISSLRINKIWTLQIDDLLKGNFVSLTTIFETISANKKEITLQTAINLIKNRVKIPISDTEITAMFAYSKITLINELEQIKEYKILKFEEFLEFIVRIADVSENKKFDLVDKLDSFLSKLLGAYKLLKKPAYNPDDE